MTGKYIKNMGVYHGFEKSETTTMFFLKKLSLVFFTSQMALSLSINISTENILFIGQTT